MGNKNSKLVIIKLPDFFLRTLKTVSYKVHWLILGYRVALNYNLLRLKRPLVWLISQTVLQHTTKHQLTDIFINILPLLLCPCSRSSCCIKSQLYYIIHSQAHQNRQPIRESYKIIVLPLRTLALTRQ